MFWLAVAQQPFQRLSEMVSFTEAFAFVQVTENGWNATRLGWPRTQLHNCALFSAKNSGYS
jgi:hypothetical protein